MSSIYVNSDPAENQTVQGNYGMRMNYVLQIHIHIKIL